MERLTKAAVLQHLTNDAVAAKMSLDTKNAINDGNARLRKANPVIRKQIAVGGGTIQLIDSNTKELNGISSYDGNRLPKYVNVFFDRIALGYKADAAAGKEAELVYNAAFIASLRNADLLIKQDNEVIVTIPCSEFDFAGYAPQKPIDRFVYLGGIHMLREEKPFSFELRFPDGAAGGGSNDYVEVMLDGIVTSEQ